MKTPEKAGGRDWLVWMIFLLPVLWLAAILAQSWEPDIKLAGLLDALTSSIENPFALRWTERTAAFSLAAVLLYGGGVAYYKSTTLHTRSGEEHGSAEWGKPAIHVVLNANDRLAKLQSL